MTNIWNQQEEESQVWIPLDVVRGRKEGQRIAVHGMDHRVGASDDPEHTVQNQGTQGELEPLRKLLRSYMNRNAME